MSVLDRIAFHQNRRDETPNQELAQELAAGQNADGIRVIAENLQNKNPNVASDCLKVLYEIGYRQPALIAPYLNDFLELLKSKNNRMVWGGMIAIAAIAAEKPDEVFNHMTEIQFVTDRGSTITIDNGIQTMAVVASSSEKYSTALFPYLLSHLGNCRTADVPRMAEKIAAAVKEKQRPVFMSVLQARLPELTSARAARVKKIIRSIEKQSL